MPEGLQSLSENRGETQGQQAARRAEFSPGAEQGDPRALRPNHTLVLVNGRRIADFPLPFGGRSNFTDVSSIPLGMIDPVSYTHLDVYKRQALHGRAGSRRLGGHQAVRGDGARHQYLSLIHI